MIRTVLRGAALGVVIATLSLGYDAGMHQQADTVNVGPMFEGALEVDLLTGDCWNALGRPQGYPTAMWVLEDDTYQRISDQAAVDAAVASPPSSLAAFCDGVTLS